MLNLLAGELYKRRELKRPGGDSSGERLRSLSKREKNFREEAAGKKMDRDGIYCLQLIV